MVNVNKLKGKIVERNLTIEKLANEIGVNKSTLYRKLDGCGEGFLIKEADEIVKILKLDAEEAAAIFFSQFVA